jgi:hypothetical protein
MKLTSNVSNTLYMYLTEYWTGRERRIAYRLLASPHFPWIIFLGLCERKSWCDKVHDCDDLIKAYRMCWLLRDPDKTFSHALDLLGRCPRPTCAFRSAQAATLLELLVSLMNCSVRRWFYVVPDPKPPLQRNNWLSFGKFQDTERFLIPCPRHVSWRLPPSGETCKYDMTPITRINLERFSTN